VSGKPTLEAAGRRWCRQGHCGVARSQDGGSATQRSSFPARCRKRTCPRQHRRLTDAEPPRAQNSRATRQGPLLDAVLGALVTDLAQADLVERRRDGFVRVDAVGQRRCAVVELLRALRDDVDQGELGVDVVEKAVEIAENGVAHIRCFPIL